MPRSKAEWIARLSDALMSDSEADHQRVLSSLVAYGATREELVQYYIPEASRQLGEKWVSDEASFVDVTTGAARLQALFREFDDASDNGQVIDRSIPLGESVLMVIPQFEQHSIGAFVASQGLRRHGLWVRMAIGLTEPELADLISKNRFSLVGMSLSTWKSVEKAAGLVDYLRANVECLPPVVAGGRIIEDKKKVEQRTGVDFAVTSIREAIERCGLRTVADLTTVAGAL
ncbi:hypothetical protein [Sedimentitalea todarodis]|uniref:B12-binding domain-containing protein n=1 Tax=Sedimentitalea todarodis TaxID=1631240 RepID=A0ABU3VKD9_9RHOB|nr:hypothetical protein [Sedimentitalea todarodis]MDU9006635.1 hypothetical protein [Sedimentitalea todarodis]